MFSTTAKPVEPGTEPHRPKFRYRAWGMTLLLGSLYMITYTDKILLGLVAQPLKEEFGLTASQVGTAGSVFFIAYVIGGLGSGVVNKWLVLRWSLVVLSIVWALCMLPMVIAGGYTVLILSRLILGLAEGPSASLVYTAIYSWHPPEKRSAPGAFVPGSSNVAKILVAPLLALVIAHWGWRAAFVVMVVVGVAWCGLWLLTWTEGPYGERAAADRSATDSAPFEDSQLTAKAPWLSIFRTPTFLGAAAGVFVLNAMLATILTWLPSYFEVGLGYTRVQAGTLFGFPAIVSLVVLIIATPVSDRLMSRGTSSRLLRGVAPGIAMVVCGCALVSLPYIGAPALVVALVSFGYGLAVIGFPQFTAAVSQICPKSQMAGALGAFFAVMGLGGAFGPYVTGRIVDAAASPAVGYAQAFQVFGVVALVGAVIVLLTISPQRDADRIAATADR